MDGRMDGRIVVSSDYDLHHLVRFSVRLFLLINKYHTFPSLSHTLFRSLPLLLAIHIQPLSLLVGFLSITSAAYTLTD